MAKLAKFLQGAAGAAGGAGPDVEEVFSTYLYEGDGTNRNIINGIDLSNEGGMVWVKNRDGGDAGIITDTARGVNKGLNPADSDTADTNTNRINGFRGDGFSVGGASRTNAVNGDNYASWTFRKAPKFFDVVTYSGNGSNSRTISHNLGSVPGMIMIKRLDTAVDWMVYHRGVNGGTNPANYYLTLNGTDRAYETASPFNNTTPTASVFTVGGSANTNHSSGTYVAYLFAHNDDDGGFGADGDADIIKCGSYTGNDGILDVNLEFEPQFVLIKNASAAGDDWIMFDTMRGFPAAGDHDAAMQLFPNLSDSEALVSRIGLTSTGFGCNPASNAGAYNASGNTYIYMAIRRGTKVPESATEVFAVQQGVTGNGYSGSPEPQGLTLPEGSDMTIGTRLTSSPKLIGSRLTGIEFMATNQTNQGLTAYGGFADFTKSMTDIYVGDVGGFNDSSYFGHYWTWKRAPNYFDVVAYSGNSTAGRTVSHNLGVAPEMMWVKCRSHSGENWAVYHSALGASSWLELNNYSNTINGTTRFAGVAPTSSVFSVGQDNGVNSSGKTYIAYLFASLDGISKVGSYTGTGGSVIQTIDCGFTSGARFVLIKRSSGAGDWVVYDTERGITVSDTDGVLLLSSDNAETTESAIFGGNRIIPHSSGFKVVGNDLNNGTYIFYAIA